MTTITTPSEALEHLRRTYEVEVETLKQLVEGKADEDTVVEAVKMITKLQTEISNIIDRAEQDIKHTRSFLDYVTMSAAPHLEAYGKTLGPKQRTAKIGSYGIIRYEDTVESGAKTWEEAGANTGIAIYVADAEALREHMNTLPDELLPAYGAERKVNFKSEDVLKALAGTGEVLPGIERTRIVRNGKFKVGVTKPYSSRSFKIRINKALDSGEPDVES